MLISWLSFSLFLLCVNCFLFQVPRSQASPRLRNLPPFHSDWSVVRHVLLRRLLLLREGRDLARQKYVFNMLLLFLCRTRSMRFYFVFKSNILCIRPHHRSLGLGENPQQLLEEAHSRVSTVFIIRLRLILSQFSGSTARELLASVLN